MSNIARSEARRSLAQVVEPVQGDARQRPPPPEDLGAPRSLDSERDERPVGPGRRQHDLDVEPLRRQVPLEALVWIDAPDEQQTVRLRPAEERRLRCADDLPSRARSESAPVGLHAGDRRPPVAQVVRLREKTPDVLPRGEQLLRRPVPHAAMLADAAARGLAAARDMPRGRSPALTAPAMEG